MEDFKLDIVIGKGPYRTLGSAGFFTVIEFDNSNGKFSSTTPGGLAISIG